MPENMNNPGSAPSAPEHSSDAHMSQAVNNEGKSLSDHMNRMSLSTAASTALPPSSPPAANDISWRNDSPSASSRATKAPLRRAPSSNSLGGNERPSPPALHKRTSMNSVTGSEVKTPPRSPAARRSSSYFHNLSMGDRSSLPPPVEEVPKPPVTAASVAHDFFEKELEARHGSAEEAKASQTVVILQDDCYGHRFSRPKTSKAGLSTIVERPERIHASLLGVSTAYVRLGGRHTQGSAAPHPQRDPTSLPPAPFKIHKTPRTLSLRSPAAAAVHGKEWMEELSTMCERAESKLAINGKELVRIESTGHANGDGSEQKTKLHEGDLYLCAGSLAALEGALGGTCEGVDAVFGDKGPKRAFVCIRPPGHHCAADMPSGFCWLNNVHVGIGHAAITHGLTHAAIIDFDLHHGDGSQTITWDHNARVASMPKNTPMTKKTPIGYFSLHDINSYPCEMGDEEKVKSASLCIENAHGQSIWNVHLQPWKTVSEFWTLYEDRYLVLLAKARAFLRAHSDRLRQSPTHPKPKAAIFLSAGFDASEWESPGMQRHQVHVPTEFYARFTRDVVIMSEEESLGVDGRVISVLEGGYSDRALMSGVLSHMSGLTTVTGTSRPSTSGSNGSGNELHKRLSSLGLNGDPPSPAKATVKQAVQVYDPAWWSVPNLEELETLIDPLAHVAAPKGQRGKVQPTFTTPTESFIAKVVDAPQGRRSTSGSTLNGRPSATIIPRGPSPPPPEVGWATASNELRKLLVPFDRETRSCKPEDLNAEATRKRRDRQSNIGPTGIPVDESLIDVKPMQLREKRGKAPVVDAEEKKPVSSRASRRKTVADMNLLAKEDTTPPPMPQPMARPARRRSSAASSSASMGTMTTDRASDFSLPSVMDQREPLAVKKVRAPAVARAEIAKPKGTKRPTVPRVPSAGSTTPAKIAARAPAPADMAPPSAIGEAMNKDVDQLSSGMRGMSIKLNVPSKEEHDAREQKAKPAPRGRPPKATASKTTKAKSPTKAKANPPVGFPSQVSVPINLQPTTQPRTQPTAPEPDRQLPPSAYKPQPSADPRQLTLLPQHPSSSISNPNSPPQTFLPPPVPSPPTQQQPPLPASEPPIPALRAPDTPKPPHPTSNTNPTLTSTPFPPPFSPITPAPQPGTPGTPLTAKRNTKQDLPVFTATSPISFGKPRAGLDQTVINGSRPSTSGAAATTAGRSKEEKEKGEGDSTPRAAPLSHPPSSTTASTPATDPNIGEIQSEAPQGRGQGGGSIWDIPDTPQARKS